MEIVPEAVCFISNARYQVFIAGMLICDLNISTQNS